MSQWKETLEPHVKVIESIKTTTFANPTGSDLLIGAVLISDTGPTVPTLVSSRKEFLNYFASGALTRDYVNSLNKLYTPDPTSNLASTMWLNAYRLVGFGPLLISRASGSVGVQYCKPLVGSGEGNYIIRDSEILKKVPAVYVRQDGSDGFAIDIRDSGVYGNYISETGPEYDYLCNNVIELVEKLNETSVFYAPKVTYYDETQQKTTDPNKAISAHLEELYLAEKAIDMEGRGVSHLAITATFEVTPDGPRLDLNSENFSGFKTPKSFAANIYNANKDIKVRIRRYNHNAVKAKTLTESEINGGVSPWTVLNKVLNANTADGTKLMGSSELNYDFYEFAVLDPNVSSNWLMFNVGNFPGRGDVTTKELKASLSSLHLSLPDDLMDLGLGYYGYTTEGAVYKDLPKEISVNVNLQSNEGTALLNVNDDNIKDAWSAIEEDERYVVEGVTDLGNVYPHIQNHIATVSLNSNYFYPISAPFLSNYISIANRMSKIVVDSHKNYKLAPYDIDNSTVGWEFNYGSSCIYWEAVFKNRRNNQEFQALFGPTNSTLSLNNLSKEFKKSERQLLLTKRINTIFNDLYLGRTYINDNKTNDLEVNVGPLKEENNARFQIRISKTAPLLLNQFKGKSATNKTYTEVETVLETWFRTVILNYGTTVDDYRITCDDTNNTALDRENNRMNVRIEVKFKNSVKYITVYSDTLSLTTPFAGEGTN